MEYSPAPSITLVTKSLPVGILATCRQIHEECKPILAPLLKQLKDEPMRLIIDSMSLLTMFSPMESDKGLACLIEEHRQKMARHGNDVPATSLPIDLLYQIEDPDHVWLKFEPSTLTHNSITSFLKKCAVFKRSRNPKGTNIVVHYHDAYRLHAFRDEFSLAESSAGWG